MDTVATLSLIEVENELYIFLILKAQKWII